VARIADLAGLPGMLAFLRAAFVVESGAALIRKHAGKDLLFTVAGYTAYADDLLARMTNPYLGDTAERVGRDPRRKLGWDDRLIGTIRAALQAGVQPRRYAIGAAAALAVLHPGILAGEGDVRAATQGSPYFLLPLWQDAAPDPGEQAVVLAQVEAGLHVLLRWRDAGFPELEPMLSG
jgi:mannitol-1-phosphate 5-dehydrogenase